jgi:transcriptional regulator with XRE-family HTH domain
MLFGMKAVSDKNYGRTLGRRLQDCREQNGLSREQLARLLAVETERYKKWELRGPVPTRFIAPICDLLGCDPYWLLTGKHRKGTNIRLFSRHHLGSIGILAISAVIAAL